MSLDQVVVPVVYGQHVQLPSPSPGADLPETDSGKFTVRLSNFEGPFDLLLQLIGKHKLDVTEVALHRVTDDFIAYIRAMGDDWDLGEASEFLLVAATLLDLKAARLLPAAEVEDEEDLALLEARDLLFARLLQYKAFKEAAAHLAELETIGARRWPRAVSMEPRYAEALPDLVLGVGAERLFKLALRQFTPKPGPPQVSIAHIHQVRVSVREHANLLRDRLRRAGHATFSLLVADCESTLEVVARFLALLELYREGLIEFEQPVSLDELNVRWVGGAAADTDLDIDDYEGTPQPPETPTPPDARPESATPAERAADSDAPPAAATASEPAASGVVGPVGAAVSEPVGGGVVGLVRATATESAPEVPAGGAMRAVGDDSRSEASASLPDSAGGADLSLESAAADVVAGADARPKGAAASPAADGATGDDPLLRDRSRETSSLDAGADGAEIAMEDRR